MYGGRHLISMQEGTFSSRIKQWVTSLTRPLRILIKGRQGKTGEDTNGVNFQHSRLLKNTELLRLDCPFMNATGQDSSPDHGIFSNRYRIFE